MIRVSIGIILISGVILISRPTAFFPIDEDIIHCRNGTKIEDEVLMKKSIDMIGVTCALMGSLLSALVTILIKQCNQLHYSLPMMWVSIIGLISSALVVASTEVAENFKADMDLDLWDFNNLTINWDRNRSQASLMYCTRIRT